MSKKMTITAAKTLTLTRLEIEGHVAKHEVSKSVWDQFSAVAKAEIVMAFEIRVNPKEVKITVSPLLI